MLTDFSRKRTQEESADANELRFKLYVGILEELYGRMQDKEGVVVNPLPRQALRKNIDKVNLAWHCEYDSSFVWKALLKQIKDYIPVYGELEKGILIEIERTQSNERKPKQGF